MMRLMSAPRSAALVTKPARSEWPEKSNSAKPARPA
jgi:hypothetical protein